MIRIRIRKTRRRRLPHLKGHKRWMSNNRTIRLRSTEMTVARQKEMDHRSIVPRRRSAKRRKLEESLGRYPGKRQILYGPLDEAHRWDRRRELVCFLFTVICMLSSPLPRGRSCIELRSPCETIYTRAKLLLLETLRLQNFNIWDDSIVTSKDDHETSSLTDTGISAYSRICSRLPRSREVARLAEGRERWKSRFACQ